MNSITRKLTGKYLPERFTCILCGTDRIHNGIVFRGHCVCKECVADIRSVDIRGNKMPVACTTENAAAVVAKNAAESKEKYQIKQQCIK